VQRTGHSCLVCANETDSGRRAHDDTSLHAMQLLLEHHKEHWVTVRRHFKADRDRNMERYEHRLAALVPSLPPDEDTTTVALAPMEL
jgi:hypothetical protein